MMKPNATRPRTPWLALLGLLIAPTIFLLSVNWSGALNNNILELLPDSGESAEAQAARQMLSQRLSYPVILKASAPGVSRTELNQAFHEAANQPVFLEPFILGDTSYQNDLLHVLKTHRETLFASNWLEGKRTEFAQTNQPTDAFINWLATDAAQQLNAFLDRPESMAYADEIPTDPLLLLPSALAKLPPAPEVDGDALIAWIPLAVDPLTPEGQDAIENALAAINSQMQAHFPNYTQTASGVYALAQASEQQTQDEVTRLNIEMLAAILLLLLLLAGRPGFLLLTIVPVVVAALWCVTAGLLVFGHIHVVALAVSSVVLGLSVDYAVHLAAKRGNGNLRDAWKIVRLPLATSCISTCFGFLFLLLSPMAALKQVGIMVPAGLIGTLFAVRYLLPWLEPIAGAYRLRAFIEHPGPALRPRVWMPIAGVAWLIAMGILLSSSPFADDIKDFQAPIKESLSRYRDLADSIHHRDVNERWYCFANSPTKLVERINEVRQQINIDSLHLPAGQTDEWNHFALQSDDFAEVFRAQLEEQGFDAEAFTPFFSQLKTVADWNSPDNLTSALDDLATQLHGPLQALLMTDGTVWVAAFEAPPGKEIPESLTEFTRELAQQKSLNRALMHAREGIARSAEWGFVGIAICVFLLFRLRAVMTMAVPVWSVTLGVAATIALGNPLGLLAVIGAILAFCLALDYGAFAATSSDPPASIRISAATTFCGFFILSFCSMPAVAQLGQVVAASVFFAWLASELLCLPLPKKLPQDKD